MSSTYAYCSTVVYVHSVGQLLLTLLFYSCLVTEHVCADVLFVSVCIYIYMYICVACIFLFIFI